MQWNLPAIPTRTDDSIGQAKQDAPNQPTYDPIHEQNAAEIEALKSAVIAMSQILGIQVPGISGGSTPGSLTATYPNVLAFTSASADAIVPATCTGSGGHYPTNFAGGETLSLNVDNVQIDIVFQVTHQLLAQVIARINTVAATVGVRPIADSSGGQLRLTSFASRHDQLIVQSGTAMNTLGLHAGTFQSQWNGSPTNFTPILQALIDSNYGGEITIPPGNYYITPGIGKICALHIKSRIRIIWHPGAIFYWDTTDFTQDCILIEGVDNGTFDATGVELVGVRILPFGPRPDLTRGRHAIVVHSPYADISVRDIGNFSGWGVLGESGNVSGLLGCSFLPGIDYINSNFGTVSGGRGICQSGIGLCGNPNDGSGGGVFVHGADCQGWECVGVSTSGCVKGFSDSSISGMAFRTCYGSQNAIGYDDSGAGPGAFFDHCKSEDFLNTVFGLVVKGNLDSSGERVRGLGPGPGVNSGNPNLDLNSSKLNFVDWVVNKVGLMEVIYRLPQGEAAGWWAAEIGPPLQRRYRFHEGYGLPDVENIAQQRDMVMRRVDDYSVNPAGGGSPQGHGDPFAWMGVAYTGGAHPRGPDLPAVGRPWLNTRVSSSYRQRGIIIPNGGRVVSSSEATGSSSINTTWPSFVLWLGYNSLPDAEGYPTVQLVLPTTDDWTLSHSQGQATTQINARAATLVACQTYIKGPIMIGMQDGDAGTFLVFVANDSGGNQTVDLIWHNGFYQRTTSSQALP